MKTTTKTRKTISVILAGIIACSLLSILSFAEVSADEVENNTSVGKYGGIFTPLEMIQDHHTNNEIMAISDLPSQVDLSTSIFFPEIGEQQVNSCTAWATTYYQYTYEVAKLAGWDRLCHC